MYSFCSKEYKYIHICIYGLVVSEIKDLVSPERRGQITRKLHLTHPVLPVPFNLEAIPEMETVHYQDESVILGTQQLVKLQSLEEKS